MGTYAKGFEIPDRFPAILREFAKEAIREQPADIYRFGYEYFENLSSAGMKNRPSSAGRSPAEDAAGDVIGGSQPAESQLGVIPLDVPQQTEEESSGGGGSLSQDVLMDRIALLFQEADTDGNGTLSRAEFQQVIEMFGADVGLTSKDVLKIMAEADSNDDGAIDYKEFLPVATQIITAIMAKEQYSENKVIRKRRTSAKTDVHDYLMKGMPRRQLEKSIQEIFRGADGDGSGALDRSEFVRCLKESGLGFTRQELNLVLTLIDRNGDGVIDYQEFLPVCFSMIVEILSDKVQEIPEEEAALRERVLGLLLDKNGGNECMAHMSASECLYNAGLGLRYAQVPAIMSAVSVGKDGTVAVTEVSDAVAGVMCALKQLESLQVHSEGDDKLNEFHRSRKEEGLGKVAGLDAGEFKIKIGEVLRAKSEAESETFTSKNGIGDAIKEAFPELEPRQIHALENLADLRNDGHWGFANVEKWGFQTLQDVQNQRILFKSFKTPLGDQTTPE